MMRDPEKTIGNLIAKQKTAYLSSVDQDGFPNTKAMLSPKKVEGIHTIYFSTNTSSNKVTQFENNPKACVYFCDRRFFRGVMLKGTVEVLHDPAIKKALWTEGDEMYYPKGVTDPDYCILKLSVIEGRYYSNFSSETFPVNKN